MTTYEIHTSPDGSAPGELTEADLESLREIHERRRIKPQDPQAGNGFPELVELFARRAGTPAPTGLVFRCAGGCDKQVARRGSYCDPCAAEDRLRQRQMMLADAFQSVSRVGSDASGGDSLEWCRAGNQQYLQATQKARDAAMRLADPTIAVAIIERAVWKRDTGNVVILGPTRIGKSKAAIACAHRVLDKGLRGKLDAEQFRFARGVRVVSGLKLGRARVTARLGGVPELERVAQQATLLILDEVGFEEDATVIRDVIYDRCEDRRRPMFITSGLTCAAFESRYGAPTMGRLKERGVLIDLHRVANTKAA